MQKQLEIQEQHYQDVVFQQTEVKKIWHDIKKYMLAMENLVSKQPQEAIDEFHTLQRNLIKFHSTVSSGNVMADGILNHEMQKASESHVDVKLQIWLAPKFQFPTTDFYIIIGNTLDNAIEACTECRKQNQNASVSCILHQKNHILFYEIQNPIPHSFPKKDQALHGFGLDNVKTCVKRNNGQISINTDNETFIVTITLNV